MPTPRTLQEINKEIVKIAALSVPGVLMMALGLYGFFVAEPGALHPWLEQPRLVIALLGAGVISWLWYALNLLRLTREKIRLLNK